MVHHNPQQCDPACCPCYGHFEVSDCTLSWTVDDRTIGVRVTRDDADVFERFSGAADLIDVWDRPLSGTYRLYVWCADPQIHFRHGWILVDVLEYERPSAEDCSGCCTRLLAPPEGSLSDVPFPSVPVHVEVTPDLGGMISGTVVTRRWHDCHLYRSVNLMAEYPHLPLYSRYMAALANSADMPGSPWAVGNFYLYDYLFDGFTTDGYSWSFNPDSDYWSRGVLGSLGSQSLFWRSFIQPQFVGAQLITGESQGTVRLIASVTYQIETWRIISIPQYSGQHLLTRDLVGRYHASVSHTLPCAKTHTGEWRKVQWSYRPETPLANVDFSLIPHESVPAAIRHIMIRAAYEIPAVPPESWSVPYPP